MGNAYTDLRTACRAAGLEPVPVPASEAARRGRPPGTPDSHPRRQWRDNFEQEAALMRERFGHAGEYQIEKELGKTLFRTGPSTDPLAQQVLDNEEARTRSRALRKRRASRSNPRGTTRST